MFSPSSVWVSERNRRFGVRGGERPIPLQPRRSAPLRSSPQRHDRGRTGLGRDSSPGKLGARVKRWVLLSATRSKLDYTAPAALGHTSGGSSSSSSSGVVGGAPRRAAPHVLTRVFLGKLALVRPKRRQKATRQQRKEPSTKPSLGFAGDSEPPPGQTSASPLTAVWERGRGAEPGDV